MIKDLTIKVTLDTTQAKTEADKLYQFLTNISGAGSTTGASSTQATGATKDITLAKEQLSKAILEEDKILQQSTGDWDRHGQRLQAAKIATQELDIAFKQLAQSNALMTRTGGFQWLTGAEGGKSAAESAKVFAQSFKEMDIALQQAAKSNAILTKAGAFQWITGLEGGKNAAESARVFSTQIALIEKAQVEALKLNAAYMGLSKTLMVSPQVLSSWNLQEKEMNDVLKRYQAIALMAKQVGGKELTTVIAAMRGGATSKGSLGQSINIDAQGLQGLLKYFDDLKIKAPAAFDAVNKALIPMGVNLTKTHGKVQSFIDSVKSYAGFQIKFYAGMAAIFTVTAAITSAARESIVFAQSLKEIQAVTGATDAEIKQLSNSAKQLSVQTPLAATEIAKLGLQLMRAGLNIETTIAAMEASAKIATISGEDLTTVADTLASVFMIWKLGAEDATRAGTALAAALNYSKLNIQDFGTALNYVGGMASTMKFSLEEVAAVLASMSNLGVKASTMATGWRQFVASMAAPSKQLAEHLSAVGANFDKLNVLKIDGPNKMATVLAEMNRISPITGKEILSVADVVRLLERRTSAFALALKTVGVPYLLKMQESMKDTRAYTEGLARVMEGPIAAFKLFGNQIQLSVLNLSEILLPVIRAVINGFTAMASVISHSIHFFTDGAGKILVYAATLTSAIVVLKNFKIAAMQALALSAWNQLIIIFNSFQAVLISVASNIALLGKEFKNLWYIIARNPLGLLLMVITAIAGSALLDWLIAGQTEMEKMNSKTKEMTKSQIEMLKKGEELRKQYPELFQEMAEGATNAKENMDQYKKSIDDALKSVPEYTEMVIPKDIENWIDTVLIPANEEVSKLKSKLQELRIEIENTNQSASKVSAWEVWMQALKNVRNLIDVLPKMWNDCLMMLLGGIEKFLGAIGTIPFLGGIAEKSKKAVQEVINTLKVLPISLKDKWKTDWEGLEKQVLSGKVASAKKDIVSLTNDAAVIYEQLKKAETKFKEALSKGDFDDILVRLAGGMEKLSTAARRDMGAKKVAETLALIAKQDPARFKAVLGITAQAYLEWADKISKGDEKLARRAARKAGEIAALKADWERLVDEIYGLSDDKGIQRIEKKYATLKNKLLDQFNKITGKVPVNELTELNKQMKILFSFMDETKGIEISIERVGIEDALKEMSELKDLIGDSTVPIEVWGNAYAQSMEIAREKTEALWKILEDMPEDVSEEQLDKIITALSHFGKGESDATTDIIKSYFKFLSDGVALTEEYANAEKEVADRRGESSKALALSMQLEQLGIQKKQLANNQRMVEIALLRSINPELQKEFEIRKKLDAQYGELIGLVGKPSLEEEMNFYKELEPYGQKYHDLTMEWIEEEGKRRKLMYKEDFDQAKWVAQKKLEFQVETVRGTANEAAHAFNTISSTMETVSQLYKEGSKEREKYHKMATAFETAEKAAMLASAVAAAVLAVARAGANAKTWVEALVAIAAVAAALAAVFASAGVSFGGGGTSASTKLPESTVLGAEDGTGSDSTAKSLELLKDTYEMEYRELKELNDSMTDLNNNITGLVASIVRTGGITPSSYNVPDNMQAPSEKLWIKFTDFFGQFILNISPLDKLTKAVYEWLSGFTGDVMSWLFGGEVDVKVKKAGIEFGARTVQQLLDGISMSGRQFADIKETTSGGLFGEDDVDYYTLYQDLDENINMLFTNVFRDMSEVLVALSKSFGADMEETLAYMFPEVKLNLKGMDAEKIDKAIQEFISKTGDVAIEALFGDIIAGYQQVGEGLLETAIRLAQDKAIVAEILDMTNQSFEGTIPDVIAFSEALIEMAGGLDALIDVTQQYYDNFFSENEKQVRSQQQMKDILAELGLTLPSTKEGFRDLVESLDLTTESGQEAYITLMKLSEAAAAYYAYLEQLLADLKQLLADAFDFVLDIQNKIDSLSGSFDSIGIMWDRILDIVEIINTSTGTAEERLAALQEGIALLDQWVAANIAAIQQFYEIQKEAIQDQIDLINDQINALNDQKNVINEQIDALQEQVSLAKEWSSVLDSVKKQLLDMKTSLTSPKDVFERMDVLKSEIQRVQGLYAGATGSEKAGYASELQSLIADYLSIAQEAYQRPSTAYQQIYDEMLGLLEMIQTDAQAFSVSEEDLLQQIALLEEQSKAIDEQIASYQLQIKNLNEKMAQLDEQMALDIQAFKKSAVQYYEWAQTVGVELYKAEIQTLKDKLREIIGDKDVETYLSDLKLATVLELASIGKTLDNILKALLGLPQSATGRVATSPMLTWVAEKEPELIVPTSALSGFKGGGDTYINISIPVNVGEISDRAMADRVADRVADKVISKLPRSGKGRMIIQKVAGGR